MQEGESVKTLPPVTLKNYVARYRLNKKLLYKYPEHKEMLEKIIKQNERDIIDYVTSYNFQVQLNSLNL